MEPSISGPEIVYEYNRPKERGKQRIEKLIGVASKPKIEIVPPPKNSR
jgi:hypothetical protein